MTGQTEQRGVLCRILTPAGYVDGTFHLPLKHNLVDALNRGETLFRLTQVRLPGSDGTVPFFALERGAVILVAPQDPKEQPPVAPHGALKDHQTWWLLHGGVVVEGTLTLLHGVRVSDHLLHRTGFVVLKNAVLRSRQPDGSYASTSLGPWVALQSSSAIGASESS